MGKVITVMNMKGGVGKTTVSIHIAALLSRAKKAESDVFRNVLAIDYDPQFNLSQTLLHPTKYFSAEEARKTILSVLVDDESELDPYSLQVPGNHNPPKVSELTTAVWAPIKSIRGQLDLIPSTLDLMYVALGQHDRQAKAMEERFSKFIKEAKDVYDAVIIDCHPAGSFFTQTSLRNSDHVVIPVVEDRYASRGVGLMMKFMNSKKPGTIGPTPHILFNRMSRTKISAFETDIRATPELAPLCMTKTLKKYSAFSEPLNGRGFVWTSSKAYSTEAFNNARSVTSDLIDRTGV